ncbi:MAG: ATP-dependent RNA helicase [Treponema sp.]|nr:ATP-dependent RNA helicase [Treponema sp.]
MDYKDLPVYQQKEKILECLRTNQVVVVQSPTGSGKTTQIPVILHEAGYSENGVIAVTQPRRIAALSVSEFIARQLGTSYPGLVGYKMRFEDKTDASTKIKIMTDGILLQEMKLDPWMSRYSVVMVDEAHERSLNIDFVLGLLKRVLEVRKDFRVIVSSATMNVEAFSRYFGDCPIVTIDTVTFPVTLCYDPPLVKATTTTESGEEAILSKIENTISRVLDNDEEGDILVFLPGEKVIKDCAQRLLYSSFHSKIHIVPLYGRLPKEEQEKVFLPAPSGRKKVVISTNIAETSVTINGITTVIDSGLAKLNFYNPKTYTSSLVETPVSRASCSQRKGRAGRTQSGTCYRLYSRKDFDERQEYTTEEIYRTDLSEVVLRMAELGITDFEGFDFISPPPREGITGAIETLNQMGALNEDRTLSSIGKLMVEFPLEPRVSRIIVESMMKYPDVLEEVVIAGAFLSTQSPFVLPPGEEMDARKAHHAFRDIQGDFVSYVKLYRTYEQMKNQSRFCHNNYLDEKVMYEITNIKNQLEEEISALGFPVCGGGSMEDYLCCIASGMIQFVCVREGRENYRTLTADHISIHPGSSMFKTDPLFIVAGEIVRTSRMFAMSVSPLTKALMNKISPDLADRLLASRGKKGRSLTGNLEYRGSTFKEQKGRVGRDDGRFGGRMEKTAGNDDSVEIGGEIFKIEKIKGKKILILPVLKFRDALSREKNQNKMAQIAGLRGKLLVKGGAVLEGEKVELISKVVRNLNTEILDPLRWPRKLNVNVSDTEKIPELLDALKIILRITMAKAKSREYGFICLYNDGKGNYWFKATRGFATALNESLSSLESLVDELKDLSQVQKEKLNIVYRTLNSLYE